MSGCLDLTPAPLQWRGVAQRRRNQNCRGSNMKNRVALSHARLRPCRTPAGKEEEIGRGGLGLTENVCTVNEGRRYED
jgi:hypothetical protein